MYYFGTFRAHCRDHLTEYTSALSHHAAVPTGRRSAVSYTKLLFECLQKMLNVPDSRAHQVDNQL